MPNGSTPFRRGFGDTIPEIMDGNEAHPLSLKIYLSLNALALAAAGGTMIVVAEGGNFSNLRLLLIGGTFLLSAIAAGLAIRLQLQPERHRALHDIVFRSRLTNRLAPAFITLFIVCWWFMWSPLDYHRNSYYYLAGLYPLVSYGTLASGWGLIFIVSEKQGFSPAIWRKYRLEHRTTFNAALVGIAGFALITALVVALRILRSSEPYWYGAGVPILAWQVFAILIIAGLAVSLQAKLPRKPMPVDAVLFLLIWAVTAVFWAYQPVPESYWVTGPMAPNHEYYPFSDPVTFDLGSQFALIGQGIFNRAFFDRALYMSFLVYLHSIGGQNYQQLMAVQAVIFAVFPALAYAIGKHLHSRSAGIILSALIGMRGVNSLIAAAWIDTATLKHMLTDFPTAIAVAIFVLLMLKWLESPQRNGQAVIWSAGVVGLGSLLRPHVLLLLPPLLLLALWVYRPQWKKMLMMAGVTMLAFLASISPWTFFGPSAGSIVALYGVRVREVFRVRYLPSTPTPAPIPALPTTGALLGALLPSLPQIPAEENIEIPFPVTQFLHSLVTSTLIFPDSPQFLAVKATVKGGEDLWQKHWDGHMSPAAAGMLILNLAVVAWGFGAAYQRLRWRGLLPLAVLFVYDAANSLARTSGGRYLVPTDWILVGYYAIGLAELLQAGALLFNRESDATLFALPVPQTEGKPLRPARALVVVAALALIGGLIPLAGVLYPLRYPPENKSTLVDEIGPYLSNLGLSRTDVDAFLKKPGAVALYGRALYPRSYARNAGEPAMYRPFAAASYPRTVFALIGPHGTAYAILPGGVARVFPNASDAIVLGCKSREEGYDMVSALAVVLPERGVSYARSPSAPLDCPLPRPVCDNNGNCH